MNNKRKYLPRRSSTAFSFFLAAREKKKELENQTDLKNMRAQRNVSGIILLITQKNFQFKKLEVIHRRFQNI